MKAVIQSSRVIGWLRRVVSTSVICTSISAAVLGAARSADSAAAVIARALPPLHDDAAALARATALAEGSRLHAVVQRSVATLQIGWRHAKSRRFVELALRQIYGLEPWQRVRLIGWMLSTALLTHGLAVGMEHSASLAGVIAWSGGLVVALVLMNKCRAIASAWEHRADAQLPKLLAWKRWHPGS